MQSLLILFTFVFLGSISAKEPQLKCHLLWVDASEGNRIPFDAFSTSDLVSSTSKKYIVRKETSSRVFKVGTLDFVTNLAHFDFPTNSTATSFQDFQLLTNPEGCSLTWTTGNNYSEFRFGLADNSISPAIGRTNINGTWYPGSIVGGRFTGAIDGENELISISSDFQYLISFSYGLSLEIRDFVFEPDIFGGTPTLMGYDEVDNLANSVVTISLTHTQSIEESRTIKMSLTKTHTKTTEVGYNLGVYGESEKKTETYTWRNDTEIHTETETTVAVTREIEVPPFESIIACSSIYFVEDFVATYIAKGIYRAKGLSAQEIFDIVAEDPGIGTQDLEIIDGEVVLHNYNGEFAGAIALNTKFTVSPSDAIEGCKMIKHEHEEAQRLRLTKKFK